MASRSEWLARKHHQLRQTSDSILESDNVERTREQIGAPKPVANEIYDTEYLILCLQMDVVPT